MLRYAADWRTLLFVAIYCTLVYVGFAFWEQMEIWQIALLFIAMCNFSFFAAVMVHNTIHCPIFKQRWMNKVFQHVLSFCYGHAVSAFVPGHNFSHHKYTQREKDVMRTTKMRWRWNFLNQLFFFHTMLPDIMRDEQRFVNAMRKERPLDEGKIGSPGREGWCAYGNEYDVGFFDGASNISCKAELFLLFANCQ